MPLSDIFDPARGAELAYKALVPVNARQYIRAATGNTAGLSDDDLWPSDRTALTDVIHQASGRKADPGLNEVDNTPAQGNFDYRDWKSSVQAFGFGDGPRAGTLWDMISKSYTDPQFRMATTVGSAPYRRNPDGSYNVTDTYDFNSGTRGSLQQAGGLSALLSAFLSSRAPKDTLLENLANYVIGDKEHNNFNAQPYTLTVGK